MTDARLRGEWLTSMRFDDLSDRAWRVFTRGLMWSAENGTDGFVPTRYLKQLHPDGQDSKANADLVAAEIWRPVDGGYQFTDWDGWLGQSLNVQVQAQKQQARERQRRYRESQQKKLEGKSSGSGSRDRRQPTTMRDGTGDVTRDVRPHVGKGTGEGDGEDPGTPAQPLEWDVVQIPKGAGEWVETGPGEWSEVETGVGAK